MPVTRPLLAAGLLGLLATALLPAANAQQVYRIVGPDGRVTFSDKPPVESNARGNAAGSGTAQATSGGGTLPFELRQLTSKYPVTLYTGPNCGPCGSGKAFLTSRGVPFVEKTVATNEDVDALQRLAGDTGLPILTVGAQQIKGYSDAEWAQYLDAAGYPKTSQLPSSFRNPPPSPLVAIQRPAANPGTAPAAGQAAAGTEGETVVNRRAAGAGAAQPRPAAPDRSNPAGITF
ncbi:MAG: glutaredoxin family protein [Haliea sp.]|nr:MAG: glutaredoxin family protein [Haliea sp.]